MVNFIQFYSIHYYVTLKSNRTKSFFENGCKKIQKQTFNFKYNIVFDDDY